MSNFMKIGPVGTELLRKNEGWTDGQTYRSNEATIALRYFEKASKAILNDRREEKIE